VVTEKMPLPSKKGPDDPKPAAYIKREYSYDYLHSPILGRVTKISVRTLVTLGIVG
jgi:hypothetical protein